VTPYYQDDAVTLYHGDAEALLCILRADAIITDPPYGVGIKYGDGYDDSRADYWEWFARMVEAMRAAAPFVAFTHRVPALAHVQGWDWIGVWDKPYASGSRIGNSPVLPHWEPIFLYGMHKLGITPAYTSDVLHVSPEKAGNAGGHIGREKWAKNTGAHHPCPKPIALCHKLIQAFTAPGQTILDPFAGSGTTLMAAKNMGRKVIGIEVEERFCRGIAERCAQDVLFTETAA
jgi:DNA modification methylase